MDRLDTSGSSNAAGTSIRTSAIGLIAGVGLLHLVLAPEHFEQAAYVGGLFVLNFVGAATAGLGIYKGSSSWGWGLGAVVAAASFILYFVTRTVGLPSFNPGELFEPLGLVALVLEGVFIGLYLYAAARGAAEERY